MRALVAQIGVALVALAEPVLVPPVGGEVTGPYTYEPYVGGRAAIALACEPGEPVRAPASGTVTFVGDVVGRSAITITTVDGWRATVGLLDIGFVPASVHTGDPLGACPAGGEISVSLRVGGAYVDPEPALQSGRLRHALWLGGPESRPSAPRARTAKYSSNRYSAARNAATSEHALDSAREILKESVFRGAGTASA